ncbi:adenylate isopentenyltransferase 5, chloroplastic-like [Solanum pennellii]|uniref:Adenylate isopentenyltransferase 5, chloroplastic-like n=1 Tax=Solanum pennellii TaxID=28526 RepID=A0ABM1FJ78_SOLPN|nr:adenylate isopentenyltransferase 5, chloroplastic-like [Solanum pennellii]
MGATGKGKFRLSVDLATHFRGEIINSDKMQVYKGLEIVTNKISHTEKKGVQHYMLDPVFMFKYKYDSFFIWIDVEQSVLNRGVDMRGDQMVIAGLADELRQIFIPDAVYTKEIRQSIGEFEPDSDFTAEDFCLQAIIYIEKILKSQRVQIIVGGSNSYIEKLVEDPVFMFKYKYDSCFIWIDVEQSVLNRRVDMRVDQMVKVGLVDEVRQILIPDADYTKEIQRSIGVPEMDRYLREETYIDGDDESKQMILQASISSIKRNTRMLICNQLDKIQRFISEKMWSVHHIIATDVSKEDIEEDLHEAWRNTVLQPFLDI